MKFCVHFHNAITGYPFKDSIVAGLVLVAMIHIYDLGQMQAALDKSAN